jgi:hypothetical protein
MRQHYILLCFSHYLTLLLHAITQTHKQLQMKEGCISELKHYNLHYNQQITSKTIIKIPHTNTKYLIYTKNLHINTQVLFYIQHTLMHHYTHNIYIYIYFYK